MDTEVFYEKIIGNSPHTEFLIQVSENRRRLHANMKTKTEIYDAVEKYEDSFERLESILKACNLILDEQPLFSWNKINSSNWYFEHLHILDVYYNACVDYVGDFKERAAKYKRGIIICNKAMVLNKRYKWKDETNIQEKLFIPRYWLSRMAFVAGKYYEATYDFSQQENKPVQLSIERAYQFVELSNRIWNTDQSNLEFVLKAKYCHSLALGMSDDRCGERVSLLKPFVDNKETPQIIINQYNTWLKQNSSVYFQDINTDVQLNHSSVANFLQVISSLL